MESMLLYRESMLSHMEGMHFYRESMLSVGEACFCIDAKMLRILGTPHKKTQSARVRQPRAARLSNALREFWKAIPGDSRCTFGEGGG